VLLESALPSHVILSWCSVEERCQECGAHVASRQTRGPEGC
jgi:hypothetical protein